MHTCAKCRHKHGEECRRFPPQVSVVMIPHHSQLTGKPSFTPSPVAAMPIVEDDLWCGEWVEREGSLIS